MHCKHFAFRSGVNSGLVPLVEIWQTLHCLVNYSLLPVGLHCSVCGAVNVHLLEVNWAILSLCLKCDCCCIMKSKDMHLCVELLSPIIAASHCFLVLMHLIEFVFVLNCSSKSKQVVWERGDICTLRLIVLPFLLLLLYKFFNWNLMCCLDYFLFCPSV